MSTRANTNSYKEDYHGSSGLEAAIQGISSSNISTIVNDLDYTIEDTEEKYFKMNTNIEELINELYE